MKQGGQDDRLVEHDKRIEEARRRGHSILSFGLRRRRRSGPEGRRAGSFAGCCRALAGRHGREPGFGFTGDARPKRCCCRRRSRCSARLLRLRTRACSKYERWRAEGDELRMSGADRERRLRSFLLCQPAKHPPRFAAADGHPTSPRLAFGDRDEKRPGRMGKCGGGSGTSCRSRMRAVGCRRASTEGGRERMEEAVEEGR